MSLRVAGSLFCLLLGLVPAGGEESIPRLLADIDAVKAQGVGSAAARKAWDRLVSQGPAVLPALLGAMDTDDTVVANWLRTAFDRIVESERKKNAGKSLDIQKFLTFVGNPRHSGRARRLALEVVEQLRPGTRSRLLAGWVGDPEFSYDAIAYRLDRLARDPSASPEHKRAVLERLFPATRDLQQSRKVARQLAELGVVVSVADHLGFLRDWYVIGPFAGRMQKGFAFAYPPERGVDLQAKYQGKEGKTLSWKRFTVKETPGGRFPALVDLREAISDTRDCVGYAYTAFRVTKKGKTLPTVEFRGAGDDNLSLWVNGKKVFAFEEYENGVRLDRYRIRVPLREGINRVLVKIVQAPVDPVNPAPNWEFILRITDASGKGLTFPGALP
jgi:hypothetical protein